MDPTFAAYQNIWEGTSELIGEVYSLLFLCFFLWWLSTSILYNNSQFSVESAKTSVNEWELMNELMLPHKTMVR